MANCGTKGCGTTPPGGFGRHDRPEGGGGPGGGDNRKPPPGGKGKCSPGAKRTANGDCIPSRNPPQSGEEVANRRSMHAAMAHPTRALAKIAARKSWLTPYDQAGNLTASGEAIAAKLQGSQHAHALKADRHAAVVARRSTRPKY